jgi:predicted transcriptional regulator
LTASIVPVGSLRYRHVFGVDSLRSRIGRIRTYVLCSSAAEYRQQPWSVFQNAESVARELKAVGPISLNTLSESEVAKAFMEIFVREADSSVWVDISSTTKSIIKVTLAFCILFGFRPYTVAARRPIPVSERTKRIIGRLFAPESRDLIEIRGLFDHYRETGKLDESLAQLRQLLENRTSQIGFYLKAESPPSRFEEAVIPQMQMARLADDDKKVLVRLLEIGGPVASIRELAESMQWKQKPRQVALGRRLSRLQTWALVHTEGEGRYRRAELTSIGMGIADALQGKEPLLPPESQSGTGESERRHT